MSREGKEKDGVALMDEESFCLDFSAEQQVLLETEGNGHGQKVIYISKDYLGAEDSEENRSALRELLGYMADERERSLLFLFLAEGVTLADEAFFEGFAAKAALLEHRIYLEEKAAARIGREADERIGLLSLREIAQLLAEHEVLSLC